jgi:Leucine-rich repeat (LRR) protein
MLVLVLLVCFFLVLSLDAALGGSSSYLHGIPQNQYNALQDFYNSTNGPHWRWEIALTKLNFSVWNFTHSANPCADNWQGLYCDCTNSLQNRCTIAKIALGGYNLNDSIPNTFDAFTGLIQLTLENNHLTDPFPDSFQHLQNISILEMKFNLFRNFPDSISHCKSLTYIDFAYNQLTNTLPSSITQLSSLSRLYLNNNYMNGTLPLGMWNLTEITELHLFHNFFTGTISNQISQLTNLKRFAIHFNSFFGSIPDSFPVSKLALLSIGNNYFSKTISVNFQDANLLEELYLFSNGFTGTFYVGNNPKLVNIQIFNNFFRGNLTYLEDSDEMALLALNDNMFTNTLPFANWTILLVYETSNNYFTGTFPSLYSKLCFLEEFKIGNNFLTGHLTTNTTEFSILLTVFNISYNLLTGTIPVVGCNDRENYCWNRTVIANVIQKRPQLMNTTTTLQTLMLNNNFFTGPFPDVTCLFTQLNLISFSNNQLTGTIPSSYSLLSFANQFTVGNNRLNGPIGSILAVFNSSKRLNVLDLSENEFTGTVPDGISTRFYDATAKTLHALNLGINCLSGTLPEALCQLSNLRTLILDGLTSSPNCIIYLFPMISG